MIRKRLVITSIFVLAALAVGSFAGLSAFAWHVDLGGVTTSLSATSVTNGAGKYVYDTANVKGVGCSGPSGSCGNVYGVVHFQVYSDGTCTGTPVNWPAPVSSSYDSITIASPGSANPGVFVSDHFSTAGLTPGSYSFSATYVSGDYWNSSPSANYTASCEPFTITPSLPPPVPEFPLGAFGMLALLGMMIPLLYVMRAKFSGKIAVQ